MVSIDQQKSSARRDAKALRAKVKAHMGLKAAEAIADHVIQFFSLDLTEKTFGLYSPIGSELDARLTTHALEQAGARLALPVIVEKGEPLIFRHWAQGDPLNVGPFDIEEPIAEAPEVVPDILLVPTLAFDEDCHRLGYGGGFYDRTLAKHPHIRAFGLAFAAQFVDKLPLRETDVPLHGVITEEGVFIPRKDH